jgi:hypothetical protein
MSNRVVNLILVGFIAVLCILLFLKSNRKPERDVKHEIELKNKYDSCQRVITGLKDSMESNKLVINNLNNLDKLLMEKYKSKKNEISKLHEELSKKNDSVQYLNCVQLESELTNRYK